METPASALMDHLESALGTYTGAGVAAPEWELPFSVFRFDARPEADVNTLVSFGIGTHLLVGGDSRERRQELVVALRSRWDRVGLAIAASTGAYLLEEHTALLENEVVRIPPELETPLESLVAAPATAIARGLGPCEHFEPPVEFVWLFPFAAAENHVVVEHGWRILLELLNEGALDSFDLARPSIV